MAAASRWSRGWEDALIHSRRGIVYIHYAVLQGLKWNTQLRGSGLFERHVPVYDLGRCDRNKREDACNNNELHSDHGLPHNLMQTCDQITRPGTKIRALPKNGISNTTPSRTPKETAPQSAIDRLIAVMDTRTQ